jgi:tellurite resistance protein
VGHTLNDPKYVYADILIALAQIDGTIHPAERALLDGILGTMNLDAETLEQMWLTPRTPDVGAAIPREISDKNYRNCLLKDAYLLASADDVMKPTEVAFLAQLREHMQVDSETHSTIHNWVQAAIDQARIAEKLFGATPAYI